MAADVEVLDDVHEEVLDDDTEQAPNEGENNRLYDDENC